MHQQQNDVFAIASLTSPTIHKQNKILNITRERHRIQSLIVLYFIIYSGYREKKRKIKKSDSRMLLLTPCRE